MQPEGFALIRDDLLHPLLGGNKWRKLDGLWAQLAQVRENARDWLQWQAEC